MEAVWIWVASAVGIIMLVVGAIATITHRKRLDPEVWLWSGIAAAIIGAAVAASALFWLYGTEAGARAIKTFQSQTQSGLTRVVTVYDMEGDVVQIHVGKFDVEWSGQRLIFDVPQDDGTYRRVQIQSSTGTITVEEVGENDLPYDYPFPLDLDPFGESPEYDDDLPHSSV